MKRWWAVLGFSLCSSAALAGPQINVGVVYDYLEGDKSTYLKRVFNGGDSTAFVKVNIFEILYDADGSHREIPLQSQPDMAARDGLMASPARLIVPANGVQGTRLLYMGERDKERYFRVHFIPVVPEKDDEFAITPEEREAYKKDLSAGVNILAGYGTVFFVRPKDSRYDSVVNDTPTHYSLRNNGNTVVVIREFKDCSIKQENDCQPTTKHHVLAGRTFKFDKQAGREYRFDLVEGTQTQKVRVVGQ